MYTLENIITQTKGAIEKACGLELEQSMLSEPPSSELGDLSTSIAFKLAKKEKKSPVETAKEILKKLGNPDLIKKVSAAGPYINFYIDWEKAGKQVLEEAMSQEYASSDEGKGKWIVIDYSSPNVAKPMHIGHLRSTIIGDSIHRMYKHLGYSVHRVNHIGDWGVPFGKLIAAYKKWGDEKELEKDPIHYLVGLYVKYNQAEEENPPLKQEAVEWFKKLEAGDPEAKELWEKFKVLSIQKFEEVYQELEVEFDSYKGEAYYALNELTNKIVEEALEKGVAVEEEPGTIIVPLEEYGLVNARLVENKRTLYITRDLAAAKERWEEFKFKKNLYIVAVEQEEHFKQLRKVLELMGYGWWQDCVHVKFGMMSLPEGRISTRKGKYIELKQVLDLAVEKANKIIEEKNPSLKHKEETAKSVGIGAVKFADLSQNRIKNIVFDPDKMVSFEGDTGPYLQYAHVRCCSILEKAEDVQEMTVNMSGLNPVEVELVKKLAKFPEIVKDAAHKQEPHRIAQYLLDLAHQFSAFYESTPVLKAEGTKKGRRIAMVKATENVLRIGLDLLGIQAPEKM